MSISAHLAPLDDVLVGDKPVMLAPANAMRIHLIIHNNAPASSGSGIRWGDATVRKDRGCKLSANTSRDIQTRGPVWAVSETTDTVWVSMTDDIR